MIAGPSEILVLADGSCDPAWVAADLLSQAEHDRLASPVLVTDSEALAKAVQAELGGTNSAAAPRRHCPCQRGRQRQDHPLHRPAQGHRGLQHHRTGALGGLRGGPLRGAERDPQCGQHLPWPQRAGGAGRLLCGPQPHPATSGTARFSSPLGVDDFVKKSSFIYYTRDALEAVAPALQTLPSAKVCTPTPAA